MGKYGDIIAGIITYGSGAFILITVNGYSLVKCGTLELIKTPDD